MSYPTTYKSAIADFLEEFVETYVYHYKDKPKFFNMEEMKKELDHEIEQQLKNWGEHNLIGIIESFGFDDATDLVTYKELSRHGIIKTLARAIYKKQISYETTWGLIINHEDLICKHTH
jgi:hypothetical protein